jgi:hypothetical protein
MGGSIHVLRGDAYFEFRFDDPFLELRRIICGRVSRGF